MNSWVSGPKRENGNAERHAAGEATPFNERERNTEDGNDRVTKTAGATPTDLVSTGWTHRNAQADSLPGQGRKWDALQLVDTAPHGCVERLSASDDPRAILVEVLRTAEEVLAPLGVVGVGLMRYIQETRSIRILAHIVGGVEQNHPEEGEHGDWPVDSPDLAGPWHRIQNEEWIWGLTSDPAVLVPRVREYHEGLGARSVFYVPLRTPGRTTGWVGFSLRSQSQPTPEQRKAVQALATPLALTSEMVRLNEAASHAAVLRERERLAIARASEAARVSDFLVKTLGGLSSGENLSGVLESIIRNLAETLQAAHVSLLRHDDSCNQLRLELAYVDGKIRWGMSGDELPLFRAPFSADITPAWKIMNERRGLFTTKMIPIPVEDFAWPGVLEYAERFSLSDMAHIVLFAGETPVGSIGMGFRNGRELRPEDKPFIEAVAQQAALAIRLIDLGERTKELALAKERALAAEARSALLQNINSSFQRTAFRLSRATDARSVIIESLRSAGEVLGGGEVIGVGLVIHEPANANTRVIAQLVHGEEIAISGSALDGDWPISDPEMGMVWDRITRERLVWGTASDPTILVPKTRSHHESLGTQSIAYVALQRGDDVIGFLALNLATTSPPSPEQWEILQALSVGVTLAVEMLRLSEADRELAIMRERERAAKERAAELSSANAILSGSLSRLAQAADINEAVQMAVRAAAAAAIAEFGVLGIFDPKERGFRNLSIFADGRVERLDTVSYSARLYSLDEEPIRLAWEQFQSGNVVLWCKSDSPYLSEDSRTILHNLGLASSVLIGVRRGAECIGYLGLASRLETPPTTERRELLISLANQIALMLELWRLAKSFEEAAVAHERETAAQERAAELQKTNAVITATLRELTSQKDPASVPGVILLQVARQAGAQACKWFEFDAQANTLRASIHIEDGVLLDGPTADEPELLRNAFNADITPAFRYLSETGDFVFQSFGEGSPLLWPGVVEWHLKHGRTESLAYQVRAGDQILGVIGMGFREITALSDTQRELVKALANQFALSIRMVQLSEQTRELAITREREEVAQQHAAELQKTSLVITDTLRHLASKEDPASAIGIILLEMARQARAHDCYWFEYDPLSNELEAKVRIEDGRLLDGPVEDEPEVLRGKFSADVTEAFRSLLDADDLLLMSLNEDSPLHWPGVVDWHRKNGRTEALAYVVKVGDRPLGILGMGFRGTSRLSESQQALVRALANQLALALQLLRLSEQARIGAVNAAVAREQVNAARERVSELVKANHVITTGLRRIATEPDLSRVPGIILLEIASQAGAEACCWFDYEPERRTLQLTLRGNRNTLVTERLEDDPPIFYAPFPADITPAFSYLMALGDMAELSSLEHVGMIWPGVMDWHRRHGRTTMFAAALRIGDQPVGVLGLGFRQRPVISESQKEVLRTLFTHFAVAVHLTRLSREASLAATLDERNRIAREIHDSLAQCFTGILMQIQAAEKFRDSDTKVAAACVSRAKAMAREGLQEARRSVLTLAKSGDAPQDLVAAVRALVGSATADTGLEATVHVEGAVRALNAIIATNMLRVCQEALANAQRYAQASSINIVLKFEPATVSLRVTDDGIGFELDRATNSGLGITGMRNRAERIGGTCSILTSPGCGTSVVMIVPFE